LPPKLAEELADSFIEIRRDAVTSTLGRSAPGKFVESFVQALQHLARGTFDAKPNVDEALRTADTNLTGIDDGLRTCAARIARAMYTLRNKRNIAHKGTVDPNTYDLRFLLGGAQWIIAELVRNTNGLSMNDAGRLIDAINAPVGGMVEDFGGKRLVHGDLTIREEILVLMHSFHSAPLAVARIVEQLDRHSGGAVRSELRRLWHAKLVEGSGKLGYRLTKTGLKSAIAVMYRETDT
jgi:predicted pyridoxine 5'-phosphate oxidase superfamily flavin-nucleotide-binding protein